MAASVWSGYLTFGLISMPVRLFSGARSSGISFNMLHRTDKQTHCPWKGDASYKTLAKPAKTLHLPVSHGGGTWLNITASASLKK